MHLWPFLFVEPHGQARGENGGKSLHHEGTKHALSKVEGNTKFTTIEIRTLRALRGE